MEIRVCDVNPIVGESTGRYVVTRPNGEVIELDLCGEHAEPIEVLVERKKARQTQSPTVNVSRRSATKKVAKKAATRGRQRRAVTTLHELERSKS